jgi:hypothetical protein
MPEMPLTNEPRTAQRVPSRLAKPCLQRAGRQAEGLSRYLLKGVRTIVDGQPAQCASVRDRPGHVAVHHVFMP